MAMIMLSFQRVNHGKSLQPPSSPICDPHLSPGCASCAIRCACQLRVHKWNMEMSWCHRPKVDFARKVLVWNKLSTILYDLQEPLLSLLIFFLYIFITMILFPGWLDWVVGLMDWWTNRGEQRSSQSAALMQLLRTGPSVRCSPFSCFDWRMHYESMCVMYSVNADAHAHTRM